MLYKIINKIVDVDFDDNNTYVSNISLYTCNLTQEWIHINVFNSVINQVLEHQNVEHT